MKNAGFPKQRRLLKPAQFDRTFKEGRRLHEGAFSAVLAGNTEDGPRIGFALGKRFAAKAVQRNRLKRQLRERFRSHGPQLGARDMVFFLRAKPPTNRASELIVIDRFWTKVLASCARS